MAHGSARSREARTRARALAEIVGVITDSGMFPVDGSGVASIYRAASSAELDPVIVVVRVAGHAAPLAPRVAALAGQVDADLQLRDVVTLEEIVAREQDSKLLGSIVVGSILPVAVVLSAAGLYALMVVAVQRRTREIGIRIALGANPRRVCVPFSPVPLVSSAAASSQATASSCSSRGAPTA